MEVIKKTVIDINSTVQLTVTGGDTIVIDVASEDTTEVIVIKLDRVEYGKLIVALTAAVSMPAPTRGTYEAVVDILTDR